MQSAQATELDRRGFETLLSCEPDPDKPEDVEKFDADNEGRGGDDAADEMRYAMASRAYVFEPKPHQDAPELEARDALRDLNELFTGSAPDGRDFHDFPAGY